jgi:ABC-type lipoprotein release transport system permease subunit
VLNLVLSEGLVVSLVGAAVGCLAGYVAVQALKRAPELIGVFQPSFEAGVFGRALAIAFGMALVGATYPAVRAALLVPLSALRHE